MSGGELGFFEQHKLTGLMVPYGSRVYGTAREDSDHDFINIADDSEERPTGTELRGRQSHLPACNVTIYKSSDFEKQLAGHKVHALEAWFHDAAVRSRFPWSLNKVLLRQEFSAKASHSFVKAKKKIEKEQDWMAGWKSLFHSLRILNFGIQIAGGRKSLDFSAANGYWSQIYGASKEWAYYKAKFQPEYNRLATEFRKLAPLDGD